MNPDLQRLLVLVNANYRRNHEVAFYAGQLGLTPDTLDCVCRSELGITAAGVIVGKLMERAKSLLEFHPVGEVGQALGFSDPENFHRFFRQHAGLSATHFKQKDSG